MVHAIPGGTIYAFIADTALIRAKEPGLDWKVLGDGFGGSLVLHLAAGASGKRTILYVVAVNPQNRAQSLYVSRDDGRSWKRLGAAAG